MSEMIVGSVIKIYHNDINVVTNNRNNRSKSVARVETFIGDNVVAFVPAMKVALAA